jgi:hypothetical protein
MQESLQEVAVDAWTVWGLIVAVRCMIAAMVYCEFRCTLTVGTAGQSWAQIAAWGFVIMAGTNSCSLQFPCLHTEQLSVAKGA